VACFRPPLRPTPRLQRADQFRGRTHNSLQESPEGNLPHKFQARLMQGYKAFLELFAGQEHAVDTSLGLYLT
jgi:hypothetical protein